ncbi:hypothetical protein FACS189426_20300 [Bacteroidia bacterium]|nr:hypothetical protein FACS189426_20300 [Bacteroidia bacterium]
MIFISPKTIRDKPQPICDNAPDAIAKYSTLSTASLIKQEIEDQINEYVQNIVDAG